MSYYNRRHQRAGARKRNFKTNSGRGRNKQYIHPSKFVNSARPKAEEDFTPRHLFNDFEVVPQLKSAIANKGFTKPSPIQDQTIPHGLSGRDVIGIANTGTGKTVAFAVPVINKLVVDPNSKAIILAPTRELAEQILQEFKLLSKGSKIFWALLIGGSPMYRQLKDLQRNPNLIIGTPGRVKDHISRRSLNLDKYNTVVLDEVDRMLDMGFVNDVKDIVNNTNAKRQSFFFSATMETRVEGLISDLSHQPVTVSVKTGDTSDNIEQSVVRYSSREEKERKLYDILSVEAGKLLIFDDTRRSVEQLSKTLGSRGFKSESIHGGRSQGQRRRALANFKESSINVLVATDVAARGIDVSDVTHVINYSTPQSYDDYIHRIGRAGRAGKKGYSMTFVENN